MLISGVLFICAAAPQHGLSPVSAALAPYIEKHKISGGVVAMGDRHGLLGIRAIGDRNIKHQLKMLPDTVFRMASMTKPVTAVAIMILVDEGRIRLDDPISKYIPEFSDLWMAAEANPLRKLLLRPTHPITVRNLLTHTAGLPNWTPLEVPIKGAAASLPLSLASRLYAMAPLESEPGTRWEYSSDSFNLLGRIIEVVSGASYEDFLRTRIFEPLQMKETTFSPDSKMIARLADAYKPTRDGKALEEAAIPLEEHPLIPKHRTPVPAGGLFSTATDFVHFCQMLLNRGSYGGRQILRSETVDEMTSNRLGLELHMSFGLGLFVNPDGSFGHNGAYGTIMTVFPAKNCLFLLLVQQTQIQRDGYNEFYEAVRTAAFREFLRKVQ